MDLLTAAERIASLDRSPVELKTDECLHRLDKFASCETCFTICPVNAIQPGKPPSLDNDKCQTCLACLPACPVGAYSAVDVVPPLLNCVTRASVKSIELLCVVHSAAETGPQGSELGLRIRGCLSSLGTGTYLVLLAMGIEKISVRLDACDQCPWGCMRPAIESQILAAKQLSMPWDYSEKLISILDDTMLEETERPLWKAENPPVSRRDLFRLSSYIAQPEILQSLSNEQSNLGNQRLSQDRRRVITALAHFPEIEVIDESPTLDEMGYYGLSVSEECTACGVCARGCPTGALDFKTENNQVFSLLFAPQACIACDICAQLCPQDAVTYNAKPSFEYLFSHEFPISLIEGDLKRCQKCHALMNAKSSSNFCSICDFRRKNPFGSALPPGYKAPPKLTQQGEDKS